MSEPQYANIKGIQQTTDSSYAGVDNIENEKIMTSGRIHQEIDEAIVENTYNYVVEDLCVEVSTQPSTAQEIDPLYKYYNNSGSYTLYIKIETPGTPPTYSYSAVTAANAPDFIFVYTPEASPATAYYTLYEKSTETSYIVCKTSPSSIVLEKRNQDIYTLYDTYYADPQTMPAQNWVKTDRFNEDLQINLTHTDISLTTKGNIAVGYNTTTTPATQKILLTATTGDIDTQGKINIKTDNDTQIEISSSGINATDSTTGSGNTTSYVLELSKDEEDETTHEHTGTSIEVAYKVESEQSYVVNDSVKISSIDNTIDSNQSGASIVVTGEKSYIETPILRLKIVD